jgi:hypothetical protein
MLHCEQPKSLLPDGTVVDTVDVPFLVAAYSVSCEETRFTSFYFLALVGVAVYVIGYPLFIFTSIVFHINKLKEEYDPLALQSGNVDENLQKFYFFVAGYKKDWISLFWDLLVCARKAMQMAILKFASVDDQQTFYSLLMLVMLIAHILAQPYANEHLNYLEQMSMAILLVVNLIGGVFADAPSPSTLLSPFVSPAPPMRALPRGL